MRGADRPAQRGASVSAARLVHRLPCQRLESTLSAPSSQTEDRSSPAPPDLTRQASAVQKNFGKALEQRQAQRVLTLDEARFGLKSWHRRRWCPKGVRPSWVVADRYEWFWLYAAVEPGTGKSCFWFLPRLDGQCLEIFLHEVRTAFAPQEQVVVVLDNHRSHTSQQVQWPHQMSSLRLPSYSPELNPVEQLFKQLRARLANQIFENLEALEHALGEALRPYWEEPAHLRRLTAYPWWLKGLNS
ncbi:IS630 family transposase, partial [Candidatus Acetothermia bacterium]|nr:IS630 family transposase [Candidatus Acetothermia bacterium]